ncbi:DNA invertase Pin-like site-specific DNA recombinase [Duganella sp. 3397]|uniref:recombinase family protein n=1 Tax=Duganella sp. 3397 TaxID=2817732 RepID=UPI00285D4C63|nr:recombinase family protein [Duganella sp. 3397]MDR7048618.1 DNA invertase Pin-like site-specific DNA recombinase [Duganella sp. 3397]
MQRIDGLRTKASQQLLADVAAGGTDFPVLLIYDVSRWGRYQVADEAGFYEFICRSAGIRVV